MGLGQITCTVLKYRDRVQYGTIQQTDACGITLSTRQ